MCVDITKALQMILDDLNELDGKNKERSKNLVALFAKYSNGANYADDKGLEDESALYKVAAKKLAVMIARRAMLKEGYIYDDESGYWNMPS